MIIVAGTLYVPDGARDAYLAASSDVAVLARQAPGCLDFVQAADPIEPNRINVYERWDTDEDVEAFRDSGPESGAELPPLESADVHKYRISAVEAP